MSDTLAFCPHCNLPGRADSSERSEPGSHSVCHDCQQLIDIGRAEERAAILLYLRRELSAYCSDELDAVEGMEHLKDGGKEEG